MAEDFPTWVRISSISFALLLIPAIIAGERIYTKIEKAWRNRVRWFR
jgi:hypothetical protein